ncbi:MAG TPA: laccase domain-containing protein, partial [Erythrobacter sp.]|nr:laccase domain-containing protein [Erythrobacter sp.]
MSDYLTASSLGDIPHGFSSSAGLGADQVLPGAALVRVRQVHSATVVTACDAWEEPPEADAIVTNRPALALGIVTADCAPVLLADPEARVIGA